MISKIALDEALASEFATVALRNVKQEFPHRLDHMVNEAGDALQPKVLHPAFYGSFDWHSSVHMHWLLVALLRRFPALPGEAGIRAQLYAHFSRSAMSAELAYFERANSDTFERTYGWSWLLKLHHELRLLADHDAGARIWAANLEPLADVLVSRYWQFLPKLPFPCRAGTHANSAFGLYFPLQYARFRNLREFELLLCETARRWFAEDRAYPASYEPSYDDFLSGGLMEAALMAHVLDDQAVFADWMREFMPAPGTLSNWLEPLAIADADDPKLCHLHGLNLSKAWCLGVIGKKSGTQEALDQMSDAAWRLLDASLSRATAGNYAMTHWLATFAALALIPDA